MRKERKDIINVLEKSDLVVPVNVDDTGQTLNRQKQESVEKNFIFYAFND